MVRALWLLMRVRWRMMIGPVQEDERFRGSHGISHHPRYFRDHEGIWVPRRRGRIQRVFGLVR